MPPQPDQILLYDAAVRQWVLDNFSDLVPGSVDQPKTFTLMVGTPDRAFAEYVTPTTTTPRDGKPPLPRCALTLGDVERDETRFNPHVIRKLGYTDATELEIRRANYPVPFNRRYTLDFWTEYQYEMNQYTMMLMNLFRFNYLYLDVDIDSIAPEAVYGTKQIGLFLDGSVTDTGELEPGNQERIERRSLSLVFKCWLWDYDFSSKYSLKNVEVKYYSDEDLTQLIETKETPQREDWVTGVDGIQTSFGPQDVLRTPIIQNTFLIDATIGGVNIRGRDDGLGSIEDPDGVVTSGSVDYTTGEVSIVYGTPPDAGTDITVLFFTTLGD